MAPRVAATAMPAMAPLLKPLLAVSDTGLEEPVLVSALDTEELEEPVFEAVGEDNDVPLPDDCDVAMGSVASDDEVEDEEAAALLEPRLVLPVEALRRQLLSVPARTMTGSNCTVIGVESLRTMPNDVPAGRLAGHWKD